MDDVPLCERISRLQEEEEEESFSNKSSLRKEYKDKKREQNRMDREAGTAKKTHKNAPAEMPSNRPVRRLRVTADNQAAKFRDPRFSDAAGTLNEEKFMKSYDFINEYQRDEVSKLEKALKKKKKDEDREAIQAELISRKQELRDRQRKAKAKESLRARNAEENAKVKSGKKPFYMKKSAVRELEMQQRFDELKAEGRLHKFMEKKRKHNASKDHRWMPQRRQRTEE